MLSYFLSISEKAKELFVAYLVMQLRIIRRRRAKWVSQHDYPIGTKKFQFQEIDLKSEIIVFLNCFVFHLALNSGRSRQKIIC